MNQAPIPCTGQPNCRHRHRHYRMICVEYADLVRRADNRCEICRISGRDTGHGFLMIDHDYAYGVRGVRGLLCCPCNSRLTVSPESLAADAMARYLANPWHLTTEYRERREARRTSYWGIHDTMTMWRRK